MICATVLLAPVVLLALAKPLECLHVRTVPELFHSGGGVGGVPSPLHRPIDPRRRRTASAAARPSSSSLTSLYLLKGLVPEVDDDIRAEYEEASISAWELFQRELAEGSSFPAAVVAVRRRSKDRAGDYENKYKILSDYRSYGNRELLDTDHYDMEPTLNDLNQKQPERSKIFWVTAPFRIGVLVVAFLSFPMLCRIVNSLVEVTADEYDIINDQFTPGIGILYGTFVALTLDILYERQNKVQENASVEASLLSQVTQNAICLFRDEMEIGREAMQIVADQVRIIVYRTRGSEMLSIMRSDPYARLLSIVDHYQRDKTAFTPQQESLIDGLRSDIPSLMEARAKRLSDEASSLPPTHFLVLIILTALSLVSFTGATLTITDANGNPPLESRMSFAGLSAVYILFYNFCSDMNDPFDGVYQIKRSSAAAYLMQIKWLIANQPYGKYIKFDTRGLAPVYDGNEVDELGKGVSNVETSSFSELPSKLSEAVTGAEKESEPQQEVVTSVHAIIPVALTTAVSPKDVPIKVGPPSVSQPPPKLSEAVMGARKESESKRVADTSINVPATSIAPESAKASERNAIASGTRSAKAYLPELKKSPPASSQVRSDTSHEDMVSQFQSLSGFTGKEPVGEGVTVPAKTTRNEAIDKEKISMYFRKIGGFGG